MAYGARLLSGLRVEPSRGFKSRHLRRTDRSGSSWIRGGRSLDKTCMIVQCKVLSRAILLTGLPAGHDELCPEGKGPYSMNSRRFSKSVAAAVLAISTLTIGAAAPADAGIKGKAPTVQTKGDTGWG